MIDICSLCFFFKQKTAYEMRMSDWSSDVCSSDLATRALRWAAGEAKARGARLDVVQAWQMQAMAASPWGPMPPDLGDLEAIAQESLDEALRDPALEGVGAVGQDRKSTRLNSSH